ncbi:MAG TPA: sugar phosphate isomerase/epimerase family protein [Spirochaetia bacterium]|nr:sugar phosphate isomerase/epimerase family protein [Spirochaetia bacterium]
MRNVGIFYAFWTQEWDVDFIPFVSRVKELGFDQLEVNAGTIAGLSSDERRRLRDTAAEAGIQLSYGIGLPPGKDVSSLDEHVRRDGLAFMKQIIGAVGELGGGLIGGTVHSYWPATLSPELDSKMPIWKQSTRSMRELLPVAEDHGVTLNVEVINRFEQFLLNTAAEAVEYTSQFDSPNLGILLDTFHMNIEEDGFGEAIVTAGPRLRALHVGETNRKPPGLGRMPWGEIRTALDTIGFDGPLVMEPFVVPGGTIGRNVGVWRELMPGADLDEEARRSCAFVRKALA